MNNSAPILTKPMQSIQPISKSTTSQRLTASEAKAKTIPDKNKRTAIKMPNPLAAVAAFGLIPILLPVGQAAHAQASPIRDFVAPVVFQAAGPTVDSIRSTVDAFRAVPGLETINGNNPGPLQSGRREINWDGGNPNVLDTTAPVTPFNTFLNNRGSRFTTPGKGLSQAPASGGPQGGLATLFENPTYGTVFRAFSPSRLFTPVGSNITDTVFFVPGTNGTVPATVRGFGVVFTGVDLPDGSGPGVKRGNRRASTLVEYFDRYGRLIFSSFAPASPGDGSQSFLGIVFDDARIAGVRIIAGNVAPGPNDDRRKDIVMMDDFIYSEPQALR